jgi:hypothetical protein
MASNKIVEYITKDNVDEYPQLTPEYREMLMNGTLENIRIERIEKEIDVADILKLNEYRLRRKVRRQVQRKREREFKRKALMSEADIEDIE